MYLSISGNIVCDVEVGELVCAYIAHDELWYRAEVLEKHSNQLSLFFVDFGDTQEVRRTDIRGFSADLMTFPRVCVKVQVSGVRNDDEAAHRKLDGFVSSQSILTLVSEGDKGVMLYNQDKVLLNEQLVSPGKASHHHNPKEIAGGEDLQTSVNSVRQLSSSPTHEEVNASTPSPLSSVQLGAVPKRYPTSSAPDACGTLGDSKEKG